MRDPKSLRSHSWFHGKEYYNFGRRAWLRSEGFGHNIFEDKPIIGIWRWAERNVSRLLGSKSSPQPGDTRRADSAEP